MYTKVYYWDLLIREVSLFQGLICTQKWTSETVLIREMSLKRSS